MKKILLALFAFVALVGGDLVIPKDTIDPLYQLKVNNYQNFACKIELNNGKVVYTASVKSMFDFYYRPWYYKEFKVKSEKDIKNMYVQDYITGKIVEAKSAYYVFGSRLVGPKGDDLIPLATQDSLKIFQSRYGGTKVLRFGQVTKGLIKYLDM